MIFIRPARADDVQAITDITNQAILHTTALWLSTPVTEQARGVWMHDRLSRGMPVFVAERDEQVVGFSSYGDFRPSEGYRFTVEHSLYVAPHAQGEGAGRLLLAAVIDHATQHDKHVMVGCIGASNDASRRLHESAGFVQTGLMPQVGHKFGQWLDLLIMQKMLGEPSTAPRSAPGVASLTASGR